MLFLCFGYMTGSDWRGYENCYCNGFLHKLLEPGYMLLSNTFSEFGINFWVFHILFKCISFYATIWFIMKTCENENVFFVLTLWYASYGLFLYINCPFRNLIACGVSAIAFYFMFKKKWLLYFTLCTLAISFHLSAIILYVLPFIRVDKINSKYLVILYLVLLIVLGMGGADFLKSIIFSYLPSFLTTRMEFYADSESGSVFSIGLIPRLICLYLIVKYRQPIINNNKYGKDVFNLSYIFLICSLIYYVFPMLFRASLFLGPFYVIAIYWGVKEMPRSSRVNMKLCFFCITSAIVFTTVRSVYYVPYSNILNNCIKGEFYDYSYRDNYNFSNSPYKSKND